MSKLTDLAAVLDKESYLWLAANFPEVADALKKEVSSGATVEEIKAFVLRHTERYEFSVRCEAAARHLQRVAQ
jgi:hypothetical protein